MEKFYGSKIPIKVTIFNEDYNEKPSDLLNLIQKKVEKIDTDKIKPTYFVLQCDYWNEDHPHQHLLTKDFLVIKHGNYLCFAELKEIFKLYIA